MADMVTPEDVLELKKKYPGAAVVCYVNSSAAVRR
jgi:quinolinate synthase